MKQQVSAQAKAEAARMGKEALAARLREIGMSAGDWALYEGILGRVSPQIQQLRGILGGLKERAREREWLRHQAQGELDDTKLGMCVCACVCVYLWRGGGSLAP